MQITLLKSLKRCKNYLYTQVVQFILNILNDSKRISFINHIKNQGLIDIGGYKALFASIYKKNICSRIIMRNLMNDWLIESTYESYLKQYYEIIKAATIIQSIMRIYLARKL